MRDNVRFIQEKPLKALIYLGIPVLIFAIINEAYTIFDTVFLAQLGSDVIIAFGFISNMYYFISRLGRGIGKGVSSMIARLIGGKKFDRLDNIALHGLLLIIVLTVVSQIVFVTSASIILYSFVPQEQYTYVFIYLECLFTFMAFICMTEYFIEIMNGEGNTRTSTIVGSVGIIINTIFDYILIFPFNLGVLGASLGTCFAYIITTAILAYLYFIKKNQIVQFKFKKFEFSFSIIREILSNAVPIILDSLLVSMSGIIIMVGLKDNAPAVTAVAFILIIRIETFLSTPLQSLAKGCNITIGHLFGAKRFKDVKNQLNYSIDICFLINVLSTLLLIVFFNPIMAFFTQEPAVIDEVKSIIFIVIASMFLYSIIYNANQSLVAIGHSKNSFYSLIIKFISLFILLFIFSNVLHLGKLGVILSLVLSDGIISAYSYFTFMRLISKAENESENESNENPTV